MPKAYQTQIGIIIITYIVWLLWGSHTAIEAIIENWQISLTMVFGSLIAGLTSEGGGAVAFPVFTKILHIAPQDARVFSLAIQSIGMTAASLTKIAMRIRIAWNVVLWVSLGGILGMFISSFFIAPHVPPKIVKITFTILVSSLGITLFLLNTRIGEKRSLSVPLNFPSSYLILVGVGVIGGGMSALVGNGIDIITFSVMVFLFRLSEKIATPTSVILMAINSVCGFTMQLLWLDGFTPEVQGYWLAAIPVVVIGAPLGAVICRYLSRATISWMLIGLITIEFVTTFWIIPMSPTLFTAALLTFFACFAINLGMLKAHAAKPQLFWSNELAPEPQKATS